MKKYMKSSRRGVTLLELLIVIAIVGALAATMSVSIAKSNPSAKAKAAAIMSNVNTCKAAAALYYMDIFSSNDATGDKQKVTAFLADNSEYVPAWKDFAANDSKIKFSATGDTPDKWTVTVDFNGDPDSTAIASAISAIKGYSAVKDKTAFTVTLLSGKIE